MFSFLAILVIVVIVVSLKKNQFFLLKFRFIFFLYTTIIKHCNGIRHKNMLKALEYQNEINKIIQEKYL